ncbi:hypothetical protein IT402_02045 [Candidatus Nomurabacteria bacterium]|nr:hypothetical protein [Candidatus Nomurabacteria bacterium]
MKKYMKNFKFIFIVCVLVLGLSSKAFAIWEYNGLPVGYTVDPNQPPVVDAGPDYNISLPTSSQVVTGTASDPDGSIASVNWSSRGGPATATIVSPSSLTTNITGMTVPGVYLFRLVAVDNQGTGAFDSMQITVSSSAASGSLTVSPNSCTISVGASTCTVTGATWTTSGATSPRLEDGNTSSLLSTLANNATPLQVWVAYPSTVFNLKDGTTLLDSKTVTSSCASGSSWNGTYCQAVQASVSLTASPMSLFSGNAATLSWVSSNVTSCTASGGWSGSKPTNSTYPHESTGALSSTTTFRIDCTGAYGSAFDQKTVTVLTAGPGITVELTATPDRINSGETSTLTWISSGATSCSGIGFNTGGATNNSIGVIVSPTTNTTYTINCINGSLSGSDQATVTLKKKFLFIEF